MTVVLRMLGILQRRMLWGLGRGLFIGEMTVLQIEIPKLIPMGLLKICIDHRLVGAFRTS